AGSGSDSDTPAAGSGPALCTTSPYVRGDPASTGSGASDLVTETSALDGAGFTVVCALAWLLAGSGSAVPAVTVAVLVSGPAPVGVTTIATVASAPAARVPRSQVTVVVPPQLPWLACAETKPTPAGSGSDSETPVA